MQKFCRVVPSSSGLDRVKRQPARQARCSKKLTDSRERRGRVGADGSLGPGLATTLRHGFSAVDSLGDDRVLLHVESRRDANGKREGKNE